MSARVLRILAGAAVAVVVALAGVVPGARPAGALATNTLGITPVGEADNFHVDLLPSEEMDRRAVITNRTDTAHHVRVYPVDAAATAQGGFALGERDATRSGSAPWTSRSANSPSRRRAPLPFRSGSRCRPTRPRATTPAGSSSKPTPKASRRTSGTTSPSR